MPDSDFLEGFSHYLETQPFVELGHVFPGMDEDLPDLLFPGKADQLLYKHSPESTALVFFFDSHLDQLGP